MPSIFDIKSGYQYTPINQYSSTRPSRSDSDSSTKSYDSYTSVASSDSMYEKLAPRTEELAYYQDKPLPATPQRKVRFALEKDLPALPADSQTQTRRKPRKMSSRDGAYAWFAQRRYQVSDERLEDSMERLL